jgi:hypothetical protein
VYFVSFSPYCGEKDAESLPNAVKAPVLFMRKLSFCRRVGLAQFSVSGLKEKWIIF